MADHQKLFDKFIYSYMVRKNLRYAAETFAIEANIDDDKLLDDQVFLDWWSKFSNVYFNVDNQAVEGAEVHLPELPQLMSPTKEIRNYPTHIVLEDDHAIGGSEMHFTELPRQISPTMESQNPAHIVFEDDTWKIRKILTRGDVDASSSRLMIGVEMATDHILPHVQLGNNIDVWDLDSGKEYQLAFSSRWDNRCYVFTGGSWISDFVQRRNLKEGDEIGFKWDESKSRLDFKLLSRNSRTCDEFTDGAQMMPFSEDYTSMSATMEIHNPTHIVFDDDHEIGGSEMHFPEFPPHISPTTEIHNPAHIVFEDDHEIGGSEMHFPEFPRQISPTMESHNPAHIVFEDDNWKIRKILTASDVKSRLWIGMEMVRHILPHVQPGNQVNVRDVDYAREYQLTFKKWGKGDSSYVFIGGWVEDFVKRRNLKEGDQIGFKWDEHNSRLDFKLLSRKQ